MKTSITFLLVFVLLLSFPLEQRARANPPKPAVVVETCAVVVLIVGGIVIYKLASFCKTHLPPPPAPDPPPAPPPTNSVPKVEMQFPVQLPQLVFSNDVCRDVSGYGWMDASNSEYTVMFRYAVESSTNLVQWRQECSVTGWVSDETVCIEVCTNSIPASTNWIYNWQAQAANSLNLPLALPLSDAKRFFPAVMPGELVK